MSLSPDILATIHLSWQTSQSIFSHKEQRILKASSTKEKHKGRYTIIESKNYGTHGSDIPQKKKSYENNDWVIFLP